MLANWIYQKTTTTGTGNLTLTSVTNYPSFADFPQYAAGAKFAYVILKDSDSTPIEEGWGYLSSGQLVREKVLNTYSGGVLTTVGATPVSLSAGTYKVICASTAESIPETSKSLNKNASLGFQKFLYSSHHTVHNASSTGYTMTANRLIFVPFELKAAIELDALGIRVGTGVSSTNIRLGIYDVGVDGHPSILLAETGSLATATSSVDVTGTLSNGTIKLNPGWYYTACVSNGAPAVGRVNVNGEVWNFLGVAGSNMIQHHSGFFSTYTFGALPATAPTTSLTPITSGSAIPTVALRST